jgi:nitrogenase molybdenum-iron protein alpha/beta subunit
MGVIIHGSTGCYFYPATALHRPIHCTSITGKDVIFGAEETLLRTVEELDGRYGRLAVLCSCVPSITGEDVAKALGDRDVLVLESPGFSGDFESGYLAAAGAIDFPGDGTAPGINVDGLSLLDPFWRGNAIEAGRLLTMAGTAPAAPFFCGVSLTSSSSPWTVGANPDIPSGKGAYLGMLIGFPAMKQAFRAIEDATKCEGGEVWEEIAGSEERIDAACDRFLRRHEPPRAALFGQHRTMEAIAGMLVRFLDADILGIGSRNTPGTSRFRVFSARDYALEEQFLEEEAPDLVLGSSFEQALSPSAAFVGVTHPIRGRVRLTARPLAGVQGACALVEDVLNACMDRESCGPSGTAGP